MRSTTSKPWQDTFADEEALKAKLSEQIKLYGYGYSHGKYSGAKSADMDVDESDDGEC